MLLSVAGQRLIKTGRIGIEQLLKYKLESRRFKK